MVLSPDSTSPNSRLHTKRWQEARYQLDKSTQVWHETDHMKEEVCAASDQSEMDKSAGSRARYLI